MAAQDARKIEMVAIANIKPAEYNPRNISDDMLARLRKGIREFGIVDPLVINQDGTLIGGHQRLKAATLEGYTKVPCVRVDLDKSQEKALNLALNKISGEWNKELLAEILGELEEVPAFDIELTGFDNIEVFQLIDVTPAPDTDNGSDAGQRRSSPTSGASPYYTIVFNSQREKELWDEWVKGLRVRYPQNDTISERIVAAISDMRGSE